MMAALLPKGKNFQLIREIFASMNFEVKSPK